MMCLLMRRGSDLDIESEDEEYPNMGAEEHGPNDDTYDDSVDDDMDEA